MNTTTLPNGNLQHKLDGWVGIQQSNQPITKTEKVFYTIFLVVVLSWIIGGISNLFSK